METTAQQSTPARTSKPLEGSASSPREVRFLCSAEQNQSTASDSTRQDSSQQSREVRPLTKLKARAPGPLERRLQRSRLFELARAERAAASREVVRIAQAIVKHERAAGCLE